MAISPFAVFFYPPQFPRREINDGKGVIAPKVILERNHRDASFFQARRIFTLNTFRPGDEDEDAGDPSLRPLYLGGVL